MGISNKDIVLAVINATLLLALLPVLISLALFMCIFTPRVDWGDVWAGFISRRIESAWSRIFGPPTVRVVRR